MTNKFCVTTPLYYVNASLHIKHYYNNIASIYFRKKDVNPVRNTKALTEKTRFLTG